MKKISLILGVLICLFTLGCSKQSAEKFESLEDAYFNIVEKTEVKPLAFTELKKMLSDYSYEKLVDGNQKIYTFLSENEKLMVREPRDTYKGRITNIEYTKYDELDSLSLSYKLSSGAADNSASYVVLNTSNMDLFKTISIVLNDEQSKMSNYYMDFSEQMLNDRMITITEIKDFMNLDPTLQEDEKFGIYYSFHDTNSDDVLTVYTTSTSETIQHIRYTSNATGIFKSTLFENGSLMFNISNEVETTSVQKEIVELFDR